MVERLQTETDGPCCTSTPHLLGTETVPECLPIEERLCQGKPRHTPPDPPAFSKTSEEARATHLSVFSGGSGGSGKNREADLLSHSSLRGGAGFSGSESG